MLANGSARLRQLAKVRSPCSSHGAVGGVDVGVPQCGCWKRVESRQHAPPAGAAAQQPAAGGGARRLRALAGQLAHTVGVGAPLVCGGDAEGDGCNRALAPAEGTGALGWVGGWVGGVGGGRGLRKRREAHLLQKMGVTGTGGGAPSRARFPPLQRAASEQAPEALRGCTPTWLLPDVEGGDQGCGAQGACKEGQPSCSALSLPVAA